MYCDCCPDGGVFTLVPEVDLSRSFSDERLSKLIEADGRFCQRDEMLPTACQSAGIWGANGRVSLRDVFRKVTANMILDPPRKMVNL